MSTSASDFVAVRHGSTVVICITKLGEEQQNFGLSGWYDGFERRTDVAIAMMAWMVAIPILGAMTGMRSMMPMAILCWFAHLHHVPVHNTWAFWVESPITLGVFTVLALGELIGDKLPMTPARTAPFPLIARVVFGGLVGAICATGLHGSAIEGILLGVFGAVAGAFLGYHTRIWLTGTKGFPDLPIALGEDVLTIVISVLAMGIVTG